MSHFNAKIYLIPVDTMYTQHHYFQQDLPFFYAIVQLIKLKITRRHAQIQCSCRL